MKNRLIALACGLLAAGASAGASTQTSTVLYGEVDAGIGQRYRQDHIGVVTNFDGMSRWGIRGGEDLGGGLAANFQLESGSLTSSPTLAFGHRLRGKEGDSCCAMQSHALT